MNNASGIYICIYHGYTNYLCYIILITCALRYNIMGQSSESGSKSPRGTGYRMPDNAQPYARTRNFPYHGSFDWNKNQCQAYQSSTMFQSSFAVCKSEYSGQQNVSMGKRMRIISIFYDWFHKNTISLCLLPTLPLVYCFVVDLKARHRYYWMWQILHFSLRLEIKVLE